MLVEVKEIGEKTRRDYNLCEVKFAGGETPDEQMTFSGYGSVFGNVDSYGDVIEPGAFRKSISAAKKTGNWPAMLSQHGGWGASADDMTPIGIWTDMVEDEKGLLMTGKLAKTARGLEAYELLKMTPRPGLNGLSIGYFPRKFTQGSKPGEPNRILQEVDLVEVSLVTFPANPKALIGSVKSGAGPGIRDAEKALREVGFSANEAKAVLAKGFSAIERREGADGMTDQERQNEAVANAIAALRAR